MRFVAAAMDHMVNPELVIVPLETRSVIVDKPSLGVTQVMSGKL